MAGLVSYASSDEDSDILEETRTQDQPQGIAKAAVPPGDRPPATDDVPLATEKGSTELRTGILSASAFVATGDEGSHAKPPCTILPTTPTAAPQPARATGVLIGPSRPPPNENSEASPGAGTARLAQFEGDGEEPPLSPYSTERAAVRQLTLPPAPDFDIPGSPEEDDGDAASAAALAVFKKFSMFLELKQKKDTHFNARLAQSDAMKNPALMDKLMTFVGLPANAWSRSTGGEMQMKLVDNVALAQYASTLPTKLWDPAAFPPEAYRRSLRHLQEEASKKGARAPGEPIEFVPASAPLPGVDLPGGLRNGGESGTEPNSQRTPTATSTRRRTRFDC